MRPEGKWLLALVGTVLSSSALSQDLFRSTNSTVHSYNYVEVQYLVDTDASPPLLATLLIDLSDRWSVKAEFRNQDIDLVGVTEAGENQAGTDPIELSFEAQTLAIGALYHQPLALMNQSDWIAGFMIGREEASVKVAAQNISAEINTDFQEIYAGVRRTLAARLEGEAALNYYRSDNRDQLSGDVKLVYRAFDNVDVALAINNIGDTDLFGIGLRYTW
ncbi:MAG: hypothetical protein AB8B97_04130 [Granulosicoccus sp.]